MVKASSLPKIAASCGSYAISTPVNNGFLPVESLISMMSVGALLNGQLGLLRSLSVSLPVLVIVVINIRLSIPSTASGPETRKTRLGRLAEVTVVAADRTRPARVAYISNIVENIAGGQDRFFIVAPWEQAWVGILHSCRSFIFSLHSPRLVTARRLVLYGARADHQPGIGF